MRKHILLFAVMLMGLLILAGCSHAPAVKSDSEIMNELSSGKYLGESYPNFAIKDVEIIKRQTDVEDKSDKVYVTLSVINDDESISGYIDMVLLYELYNDGWILEECELDYDGAWFRPEKILELSLDEVSSALNYATGETISDVAVYDAEADLENGIVVYSVTGKECHTYMTGELDATLAYQFWSSYGYWGGPYLTINSYEEYWHIAGKFDNPDDSDDLILVVDGSISTLSVEYSNANDGYGETESNIPIYKVSDTTAKQVMGDFFKAVNKYQAEYITKYDFSIKLTEDCTNYYSFEYVAWWNGGGNRFDGMLFVGKDQLGYMWADDYEIDEYNRRVVCDVYELLPIE